MINKTKAGVCCTSPKDNVSQDLTTENYTTADCEPQYICSICLKKVWNDLTLLNGIGACFRCKNLALRFSHFFWEEYEIDRHDDGEDE